MFGRKKVVPIVKPVNNYGSIMSTFTQTVTDLKEVVEREKENVDMFVEQRKTIDRKINISESEIGNCSVAIENLGKMFPTVVK